MSRQKRAPGEVRDAVLDTLQAYPSGASVSEIVDGVQHSIGSVPASSVRSYLRLNTPRLFVRFRRGQYRLLGFDAGTDENLLDDTDRTETRFRTAVFGNATLVHADCFEWLRARDPNSVHAVVTDPPYGLVEYSPKEQGKLRKGKGGCGVYRRHSTARNEPRCRDSPFSPRTI